ncbi:MAG: hypothetical protein ABIS28_09365, partial [Caldimonas sp.]
MQLRDVPEAILEHIEQKLTALADEVAADEQDPEPTVGRFWRRRARLPDLEVDADVDWMNPVHRG